MSRLESGCFSVVFLFAVLASAGCATTSSGAGIPTPAAGPLVERGTAQSDQDGDPLLRESNLVRELVELCDANLSQAAVAQSTAASERVRAFAASVYEDNRALRGGLDRLGEQLGLIELRTSRSELIAAGGRDDAFELASRKGSFVDRAFLESVADDRQRTLRTLQLAERTGRPELRALIRSRFVRVASKNAARAREILATPEPEGSIVAVR